MSERRRADMKRYMASREKFLGANPLCGSCGKAPSRDIHHARGRAGSLLLDQSYWIAVCRPCHDWIGRNPKEAVKLGLSSSRWGMTTEEELRRGLEPQKVGKAP